MSLAFLFMHEGNITPGDLNGAERPVPLEWKRLASLPDKEGFAAMFAGVSNDRLIAAGGANFPDKRPWEGGTKVWYDTVYVMDTPSSEWKAAGKLPGPVAYGVSVTTADGVFCIGGSDSKQHKRDVFLMSIKDSTLDFKSLPPLPMPCANMCGARAADFIYIAGGSETPDATNALHTFWALNLNAVKKGWMKLEPWPGPARILATAASLDGSFYLMGGAGLRPGADGKAVREWYKDVYRYTPGKGWERLAVFPGSIVAATSPAMSYPPSGFLVIGGDDGTQVSVSPSEHKGFPRETRRYDILANKWSICENAPFSIVTAPAVKWRYGTVIVSGERQPGIRSPEVWMVLPAPWRSAIH